MKLKHRYTPAAGYSQLVSPRSHGLELLEFGVLSLAAHGWIRGGDEPTRAYPK